MKPRGVKHLHDPLTPEQRSLRMAKVRSSGNKSTELRVAAVMIRAAIRGWKRHSKEVPGRPDFYFPEARLVVFVDGCFWHGCPKCRRNTPKTRRDFWTGKIVANRRRDRKVNRLLRQAGLRVVRIWEHEIAGRRWLATLRRSLTPEC